MKLPCPPSLRSGFTIALSALFWCLCLAASATASPPYDNFPAEVAKLEVHYGGRLGVALFRTKDGTMYTYRGAERFPMCSTFKVVAVADLLKRSQSDPELMQQRISISDDMIMPFSSAIGKYREQGITLGEIAEECLVVSDNTAANLLLEALGGPEAVTDFARSLGDTEFRLDRWEMEMNDADPGDLRDTTTPLAMAQTLHKLIFGDVLAETQRNFLKKGMRNCMTGFARLRAGAPKAWTVIDKTGTGYYGTTNAIGVLWPPVGTPLVLVVFYTQEDRDADANNEIIAAVARLATNPEQAEKALPASPNASAAP